MTTNVYQTTSIARKVQKKNWQPKKTKTMSAEVWTTFWCAMRYLLYLFLTFNRNDFLLWFSVVSFFFFLNIFHQCDRNYCLIVLANVEWSFFFFSQIECLKSIGCTFWEKLYYKMFIKVIEEMMKCVLTNE